MTKPQTEAERMASEFSQQHEELIPINGPRWRNADINLAIQMASKSGYLAGFKAALEQAEKLAKDVGECLGQDKAVYLADLKALLEPKS